MIKSYSELFHLAFIQRLSDVFVENSAVVRQIFLRFIKIWNSLMNFSHFWYEISDKLSIWTFRQAKNRWTPKGTFWRLAQSLTEYRLLLTFPVNERTLLAVLPTHTKRINSVKFIEGNNLKINFRSYLVCFGINFSHYFAGYFTSFYFFEIQD